MEASGAAALLMLDAASAQAYLLQVGPCVCASGQPTTPCNTVLADAPTDTTQTIKIPQVREGYRRERAQLLQRVHDLETQLRAVAAASSSASSPLHPATQSSTSAAAHATSPLRDQRMRLVHEENLRLKAQLQQELAARQRLQREHDSVLARMRIGGGGAARAADAVTSHRSPSAEPPVATSSVPSSSVANARQRDSSCESDATVQPVVGGAGGGEPTPGAAQAAFCGSPVRAAASPVSDLDALSPWAAQAGAPASGAFSPLPTNGHRYRGSKVDTASPVPQRTAPASAFFPPAATNQARRNAQQQARGAAASNDDDGESEDEWEEVSDQEIQLVELSEHHRAAEQLPSPQQPPASASSQLPQPQPQQQVQSLRAPLNMPADKGRWHGPLHSSLAGLHAPPGQPAAAPSGLGSRGGVQHGLSTTPQTVTQPTAAGTAAGGPTIPQWPANEPAARRIARSLWPDRSVRSSAPAVPTSVGTINMSAALPTMQTNPHPQQQQQQQRQHVEQPREWPAWRRPTQAPPPSPSAAILGMAQRHQKQRQPSQQQQHQQQQPEDCGEQIPGHHRQQQQAPIRQVQQPQPQPQVLVQRHYRQQQYQQQDDSSNARAGLPAWVDGIMADLNARSSSDDDAGAGGSRSRSSRLSSGSSSESLGYDISYHSSGLGCRDFWAFGGGGSAGAARGTTNPADQEHSAHSDGDDLGVSSSTLVSGGSDSESPPVERGFEQDGAGSQHRQQQEQSVGHDAQREPDQPTDQPPAAQAPGVTGPSVERQAAEAVARRAFPPAAARRVAELAQRRSAAAPTRQAVRAASSSAAGGSAGISTPPSQTPPTNRSRREALASLSQVHAQLSSKVELLQSLAPRAAAGSDANDVQTVAEVVAAAAALAAAGTRAAEEVSAAAAAAAGVQASVSSHAQSDTIQAHLVTRMQTIHQQLRSMLAGALAEQVGGGEQHPSMHTSPEPPRQRVAGSGVGRLGRDRYRDRSEVDHVAAAAAAGGYVGSEGSWGSSTSADGGVLR